jgi:hypothetical protein
MSRKLEIELELRIAREAIKGLLKAGYGISVDNGEYKSAISTNEQDIADALFLTDEDTLNTYKNGMWKGYVLLIYGNVQDVITDYSTSLEEALKDANALAESYN